MLHKNSLRSWDTSRVVTRVFDSKDFPPVRLWDGVPSELRHWHRRTGLQTGTSDRPGRRGPYEVVYTRTTAFGASLVQESEPFGAKESLSNEKWRDLTTSDIYCVGVHIYSCSKDYVTGQEYSPDSVSLWAERSLVRDHTGSSSHGSFVWKSMSRVARLVGGK